MNSAHSSYKYQRQTECLRSMMRTEATSRNKVFAILTSLVSMDGDVEGCGSFLSRFGCKESARFSSVRRRLATLCSL